jgi:cell division FtsZ-interacting protein ZapD
MKRPKIITRIFGLFKKAEVEEDLTKEINEQKELIEELIENSEPKDEIQTLADELLDQMKWV